MKSLFALGFNVLLFLLFPALLILLLGVAFVFGLLWKVFGDALKGQ